MKRKKKERWKMELERLNVIEAASDAVSQFI